MADKFYVGDEGTDIIIEAGEDISAASVIKIKYKKPDDSTGEWEAEYYDDPLSEFTNSALKYTVLTDDWDQAGNWYTNPYIEMGTWKGHGETDTFKLHAVHEQ